MTNSGNTNTTFFKVRNNLLLNRIENLSLLGAWKVAVASLEVSQRLQAFLQRRVDQYGTVVPVSR